MTFGVFETFHSVASGGTHAGGVLMKFTVIKSV